MVVVVVVCGYWAAVRYFEPGRAKVVQRISSLDRVGWAGIGWNGVEAEVVAKLGVPCAVELYGLVRNGPAEKAGLRAGDYLVGVDGKQFAEIL